LARIGIDIGGTSAKLALVIEGSIQARGQVATGRQTRFEGLLDSLAATVASLRREAPVPVTALGVAAPGYRALDGSGVVNVTNLPGIDGQPLRDCLAERTGLPTAVDNDANAAALGEFRYGAGRGVGRLLVVTVGTGIGAGMVVDGALLRPSWQGLGDPGHLIIQRDGPRCACGGRGCLEAIAATPATVRRAAELGELHADFPLLAARALAADGPARSALFDSARWLGAGLATLSHLLGPEQILLGGGAMDAASRLILPAAAAAYAEHAMPFLRARLAVATLGNDAGLLGAAAIAGEVDENPGG
jgi:glucokinase